MLEKKRTLFAFKVEPLWDFFTLSILYNNYKYYLSFRWGKLWRRNIVIFMAVKIVCRELSWSRFVLRNILPRKELEPEITITPRAREGRGRTISTRAVALLQYFSCACLGDWSYFISSIFIYCACLNCILYLYILQQICTYFITELPSLCLWIIPGICCRHF